MKIPTSQVNLSRRDVRGILRFAVFLLRPVALFVVVSILTSSIATAQTKLEHRAYAERTDAFLNRMELDLLRIRHLENQFSKIDTQDPRRRELAQKLSTLLARHLMSREQAGGPQRFIERLKSLQVEYPDLVQPINQLAIAQAEYLINETAFHEWLVQGAPLQSRTLLNRKWQSLTQDIRAIQKALGTQYDERLSMLRATNEPALVPDGLLQLETALARSSYLLGWCHYYSGVVSPSNRTNELRLADAQFRSFLQIEPEVVLLTIDANWIDVESVFQRRALMGLAMTQLGLNHPDQSAHCFSVYQKQIEHAEGAGALHRWKLQSRLNLDHFSELEGLAKEALRDTSLSQLERVKVSMEIWKAALAVHERASSVGQSLRSCAAVGLARELQVNQIRKQIGLEKAINRASTPETLFQDPFVARWVSGYLLFDRAMSEESTEETSKALSQLENASQCSTSETPELDRAIVEYLTLQLHLLDATTTEEPGGKIRQLETLSARFARLDRFDLAESSHWFAIGAAVNSGQINDMAVQMVSRFLINYPDSPNVNAARLLQAKLVTQDLPVEKAIDRFKRLASEPNLYGDSMLQIARLQLKQWNADQSETSWKRFRKHHREIFVQPRLIDRVRIEADLLMADALIQNRQSTPLSIQTWLDQRVEKSISELDDQKTANSVWMPELLSRRCQAALRNRDLVAALRFQEVLYQNHPETNAYKTATMRLLTHLDQSVFKDEKNSEHTEVVDPVRLAGLYQQLIKLTGTTDDRLKNDVNARVACVRLATLNYKIKRFKESSELLERLVKLFPKRKDYRRLWGQSLQALKRHQQALTQWRLVATSSKAGTFGWYESRLNVIQCLLELEERASAAKLLKQFKLLSPEPPEAWRKLVRDLSSELEVD